MTCLVLQACFLGIPEEYAVGRMINLSLNSFSFSSSYLNTSVQLLLHFCEFLLGVHETAFLQPDKLCEHYDTVLALSNSHAVHKNSFNGIVFPLGGALAFMFLALIHCSIVCNWSR